MLHRFIALIRFYFRAVNRYRLHSPIHVSFYHEVLDDNRVYYCFDFIERLRSVLQDDHRMIDISKIGQPSKYGDHISIARLATKISSNPAKCRRLFRMVRWYQPDVILELGTSLGMATLYMAHAKLSSPIITMEANPTIAQIARNNFANTKTQNITLVEGTFEKNLEGTVKNLIGKSLFVYLDGNHASQPLLAYLETILSNSSHDNLLCCIDDINWSVEMQTAWNKIVKDQRFQHKIDLFQMGVVMMTKTYAQSKPISMIPFMFKPVLW